ncbi:hypothetical protein NX059_002311 [Plenodomus lindquistii]|nr:hypothetical protein NX059_002311 [Plenodomus lindquistii]
MHYHYRFASLLDTALAQSDLALVVKGWRVPPTVVVLVGSAEVLRRKEHVVRETKSLKVNTFRYSFSSRHMMDVIRDLHMSRSTATDTRRYTTGTRLFDLTVLMSAVVMFT